MRRSLLLAPDSSRLRVAGVGVAALAAGIALTLGNPARGGFPRCPFHAATGLWCPGCGSQRALHALSNGDLSAALGYNVLVVAALPLLLYAYGAWTARTWGWYPLPRLRLPLGIERALFPLVVAFALVRNLPVGDALAP